ncbi:MAG: biotin transporter BioY [Vicingaceae bacterium]
MKNAEKQIANVLAILVAVACFGASAQLSINLPEGVAVAPITGQTLAILVAAHFLKWKKAAISVLLYFLLGALGLPVFSDFSSGLDVFVSPSAGYLAGFLLAAVLVGRMAELRKEKFTNYLLSQTFGTLLILVTGGIGLLLFLPAYEIFAKGILPFLAGGLVKIILASILIAVYTNVTSLIRNN